jgi:ubiquitin-protein ligase
MSNRNLKIQQLRNSRILKEFKEIYKNPADIDNDIYKINDGIYVYINDVNINNVLIQIIGPSETPYAYGNYFFTFAYSKNYPFEAPVVKFMTTDGNIRFNPNLYSNGKVCLSILGTWSGPPWEPTMSLAIVCEYLKSILNDNPLENEPGFENKKNQVMTNYVLYVDINNYNYAINYILRNKPYQLFDKFNNTINNEFIKNLNNIYEIIKKKKKNECINSYKNLTISPYNKIIQTNYHNIYSGILENVAHMIYLHITYKCFDSETTSILIDFYKNHKDEIILINKNIFYKKLTSILVSNISLVNQYEFSDDIALMLYQIKYKELFNNYCDNFKNKNKIELWEHYSNKYKNGISVNINKIKSVFLKLDKNTLENESMIYIIYNNNKDVITFSILDEIITNF